MEIFGKIFVSEKLDTQIIAVLDDSEGQSNDAGDYDVSMSCKFMPPQMGICELKITGNLLPDGSSSVVEAFEKLTLQDVEELVREVYETYDLI